MFDIEKSSAFMYIISYLSLFIGGCVGLSELESSYDNITEI